MPYPPLHGSKTVTRARTVTGPEGRQVPFRNRWRR